jgi:hypothetical protein
LTSLVASDGRFGWGSGGSVVEDAALGIWDALVAKCLASSSKAADVLASVEGPAKMLEVAAAAVSILLYRDV